ncbi:MAG TPA: M14 family metallopeptidase [Pyrinomonadaceae bacterium]|nr:M14 family metallopeptidase [Pyrinomonadaceae bacterium]
MNKRGYASAGFTAIILFVVLVFASATSAQTRRPIPSGSIPSPRSVLGFTPGDDRTIADWKQITSYFKLLSKTSNRVRVQTIGQSTLGRTMIAAFISAPENIRNLEKYKAIQARLADPRKVASDADRDQLIREGKTVVVISCSIHSTEIVASQMSMQLAYNLASANDEDTLSILHNTILILIPSPNPDGVDIVATYYRKTLGTPLEGRDPPELYHHYAGHDDNRDWFMLDLKETRAITRLFWKEWFPEIVYDIHQQGSNGSRFFVPPFYDPPNPHIAPLLLRQVGLIGHKMAADVTAAGFRGVLTNALYDTWWHGGFRTAPYFHNSIGILTEAASARIMTPSNVTREQLTRSGTRGMRTALDVTTNFPNPWPGGAWHPRDIMQMEMIACHSMLSLAANYRADYLRNFYELGKASLSAIEPLQPMAYLIPAGQGRDENVAKMIGALVEQGVEVHRLDHELHAGTGEQKLSWVEVIPSNKRIGGVSTTPQPMREVPAGSYIVFLNQPYRQNVLALFEPQVYPDRMTATGEAERPYDVAGWTLPMSMGLESPAVISIRETANERKLTLIKNENDVRRDLGLPLWTSDKSPIANTIKPGVRIGIYQAARGNMDEGWTRYVFDTFNAPYQSLRDAAINDTNLRANFDAIVLPSDRTREPADSGAPAAEGAAGISDKGFVNLARFVEDGGTLICFDGSCGSLIKQWKLPLRNVLEGLRSSEFYCPGSILRINVDTSNPIARTMSKDVDAYFINSSAFEMTNTPKGVFDAPQTPWPTRVIARYAKENVLRSGWLLGEDKIKDRVALAEVTMGKGRVVLFAFRPQHRGQTWGTFPFIWNAINSSSDR